MKPDNQHEQTWLKGPSRFQTTEWTKIRNSNLSQAVMGELYLKYRKPVYLYLRRRGFNDDNARDLIQDFFTDKVLGQALLKKADQNIAKFRTFLLTAVKNYAIDQYRTKKVLQTAGVDYEPSSQEDDPAVQFNKAWASQLLEQTLKDLESECLNNGKTTHWQCFRLWLIDPATIDNEMNMSDICKKLGIDDVNKAYNMIANIKERFRVILRKNVRRQVRSERQVDEEINNFLNYFSKDSTR